jgi:hypothetical protein
MVKVVANRAVIVACIAKENIMVLQLQCTRLYFYGSHSGDQSVFLRAHHCLFRAKRAVVSTDPGRCIPQRYTIAILGVSSREENPGAIEGDVRCLEVNDARCLEVRDARCLYPRPATPTLLNECWFSLPRKSTGMGPASMDQRADGLTTNDVVLCRTKCGVNLLRVWPNQGTVVARRRYCSSVVRRSPIIRGQRRIPLPSLNSSNAPPSFTEVLLT